MIKPLARSINNRLKSSSCISSQSIEMEISCDSGLSLSGHSECCLLDRWGMSIHSSTGWPSDVLIALSAIRQQVTLICGSQDRYDRDATKVKKLQTEQSLHNSGLLFENGTRLSSQREPRWQQKAKGAQGLQPAAPASKQSRKG